MNELTKIEYKKKKKQNKKVPSKKRNNNELKAKLQHTSWL